MRFGICATVQAVAALDHPSFDYLEVGVQSFLVPEQPEELFAAHLEQARRLPIPIEAANGLLPADLVLIATPTRVVEHARLERYLRTVLKRAQQAGIQVLIFGSGLARACPQGYDHQDALAQLGQHLASWCQWARPYGIEIALEPLRYAETNMLNTLDEAGQLVTKLAASGATLLADTYHMACNHEDPTSIAHWGAHLAHVHVAELRERAAPGRFSEDLSPFFSPLHTIGYDRRISIECRWYDLTSEVEPALATLRTQWATSAGLA